MIGYPLAPSLCVCAQLVLHYQNNSLINGVTSLCGNLSNEFPRANLHRYITFHSLRSVATAKDSAGNAFAHGEGASPTSLLSAPTTREAVGKSSHFEYLTEQVRVIPLALSSSPPRG